MRPGLFLISLAAILAFSQPAMAEGDVGVVYPFVEAEDSTLVTSPYLEESFLQYLEESSVYPAIDSDGLPLFYYSENGTFMCQGICSSISMNNYIFGSKALDVSGLPAAEMLNESAVVGSPEIGNFIDGINAIRSSLRHNPDALAEFESQLLEEQEGYLRSTYFENAYDDVWDYALEEIMRDPLMKAKLRQDMITGDLEGSVEEIEKYLRENFDINGAYDMSSLFSAIENKKIGHAQAEEFLRNVLERMGEEMNMDLDLSDIDKFSDLLNSEEFKDVMDRASEIIEQNPQAFDRLQDLADEMLSRPETRDVFKEAVKEMMENADWESLKELLDLFNKIDNKEQMLSTMMDAFSEHMRDMVSEGKTDEIMQMLDDPKLREMLAESVQSFSEGFLENLGDWAKEIPVEFAYIVALAAVVATLLMLIKLKI
jgi:hypothetical protein